MPKTKKKVTTKKKATTKKVAKKTTVSRPAVTVSTPKSTATFSQEFTNTMLVIFGAGMVLFAYVLIRVYG